MRFDTIQQISSTAFSKYSSNCVTSSSTILSCPVLYLVLLLFSPPILHPTLFLIQVCVCVCVWGEGINAQNAIKLKYEPNQHSLPKQKKWSSNILLLQKYVELNFHLDVGINNNLCICNDLTSLTITIHPA